jgi:hypothetical protein
MMGQHQHQHQNHGQHQQAPPMSASSQQKTFSPLESLSMI